MYPGLRCCSALVAIRAHRQSWCVTLFTDRSTQGEYSPALIGRYRDKIGRSDRMIKTMTSMTT